MLPHQSLLDLQVSNFMAKCPSPKVSTQYTIHTPFECHENIKVLAKLLLDAMPFLSLFPSSVMGSKLELQGLPTQDMVSGSAAQMQGQYGGVPSGPAYNNPAYYATHIPYAMSHPYQFMPAPYTPYGQVAPNAAYSLPQVSNF